MFYNKSNHYRQSAACKTQLCKSFATLLLALLMPLGIMAQAATYTRSTLAELGIDVNKVYYIYSGDYVVLEGSGSELNRYSRNSGNVTNATGDTRVHFAFVTDPNDESKVYLYNVYSKKTAKSSGDLVSGSDGITPVYVYATGDADFPLALSFSSTTWDAEGAVCIEPSNTNKDINTTVTPSALNKLHFMEVTDDSYSLVDARAAIWGKVFLTGGLHYTGASGRALKNGMQDVAEVHYYYYVTAATYDNERDNTYETGRTPNYENRDSIYHGIELSLPFYNFNGDPDSKTTNGYNGNNMEPFAYFRWYDYNTDRMSAKTYKVSDDKTVKRIVKYRASDGTTSSFLKPIVRTDGTDYGLVAYNMTGNGPTEKNVGVVYNIPDSADIDTWQGDVIACDVSRYCDYNDAATPTIGLITHEPTLSVRYVFHILPAKKLAEDIQSALQNGNDTVGLTYTDKATFYFGRKDDNASLNLRVDLASLKHYYFYELQDDQHHHVYHPDGDNTNAISTTTFGTTLYPTRRVQWQVYSADKTRFRTIYNTDQTRSSFTIAQLKNRSSLNGSTDWHTLSGGSCTAPDIDADGYCYIVGLLADGNGHRCPFFNAKLVINDLYPMSDAQLTANQQEERTVSYLDQHFQTVARFTFDDENSGQNLIAPTSYTSADNFSLEPSNFKWRQYGFVYYNLGDWSVRGRTNGISPYRGTVDTEKRADPLHGEYAIIKSKNVAGSPLYDRTHELDNSRYGYFMATDCSQEARMLGYQDFTGSMCPGSQIIISAYVSNFSTGDGSEQPELRFSLYGVDKDADGNDRSTKLMASVCSGKFNTNIDGYTPAGSARVWYQVFGIITLPRESAVDNYSDFRVTIDNFCASTNGADYCIDDIRVYQNNAKVTVLQDPTMCGDSDASGVAMKIKTNYELLAERAANAGSTKVYYRLFNTDGTAVSGITDSYDNGGKDYGVLTIPTAYDASATLSAPDRTSTHRFENDLAGVRELVIADRAFGLAAGTNYYVALAVTDNDAEPTDADWGRQSSICSYYSNSFSLIRQSAVIDGHSGSVAVMNVPCNTPATGYTAYSAITVTLTAASKIATGATRLPGVPFDWFVEKTGSSFADIHDGDLYLSTALAHYRGVYTTANPSYANIGDASGAFTDADKALITQYLYDATSNPTGQLVLNYSSSFSAYPLTAGTTTVKAIPAVTTFDYSGETYTLCDAAQTITLRVTQDGPGLTLGIKDVSYPSAEPYRSVRLGHPQIKKMGKDGVLRVPVSGRSYAGRTAAAGNLRFVEGVGSTTTGYADLHVAATNDPTMDLSDDSKTVVGRLKTTDLAATDGYIQLCDLDTTKLHEGYYYEVGLRFVRTNAITDAEKAADADLESVTADETCVGETYLTLKIVPEYLTWVPTVTTGFNSNWNVDANWRRSTAAELYMPYYADYGTATYSFKLYDAAGASTDHTNPSEPSLSALKSYAPMYFTKVTIPEENSLPYPMMPFIRYNATTHLVLRMDNTKGDQPTTNLQYDMMAAYDSAASTTTDSSYICQNYDGNLCEQIYFKDGAQLRQQQYLRYQRAWVEVKMPVNAWGSFATPMKQTYAGDMYVPKRSARQETAAFQPITFEDVDRVDAEGHPDPDGQYGLYGPAGERLYSRMRMPVYQRLWGKGGAEYSGRQSSSGHNYSYASYDNPYSLLIYPSSASGDAITDDRAYELYGDIALHNAWSHPFNAMGADSQDYVNLDGKYENGIGVADKVGDDYATPSADWAGKTAIMRLPKTDATFYFYKLENGKETRVDTTSLSVDRTDNYRLGIDYDFDENSVGRHTVYTSPLIPSGYPEWGGYGDKPLQYDLVGNPYTSSISVSSFVEANRSVLLKVPRPLNADGTPAENADSVYRVWVLSGSEIVELSPDNSSAMINPGQAFFVKVEMPGRDEVVFTTRMQTDPALHAGAKTYSFADEEAKVFRLTPQSDVTNIIEHDIDSRMVCWSPQPCVVAVSGSGISRVDVFATGGNIVAAAAMSGTEQRLTTGQGVFVVRATMNDGTTETRKVAVK